MHPTSGTRRILATIGAAGALAAAGVVASPPAQAAGTITVALRDGVLYVAGNDTDNVVRLSRASDGRIVVSADSRIERRGHTPRISNVKSIRISVRGGNDLVRLYPGLPKATVFGDAGKDLLVGGTAAETLRGGAGDDSVLGGGGGDLLMGEAGNDTIDGQAGNDRVVGGDGSDSLIGQSGDDILRGEAGDDIYFFDPGIAQGTDLVREFAGAGSDTVRFHGQTGVTFTLASASPQVVSPSLTVVLEATDTFENLYGGSSHDTLTGNALDNRLSGRHGNDQITGGAGVDTIVLGDGTGVELGGDNVPDYAGTDTLTDFADEDTVDLDPFQTTDGLGTSTVIVKGFPDEGTLINGSGRLFVAGDFT